MKTIKNPAACILIPYQFAFTLFGHSIVISQNGIPAALRACQTVLYNQPMMETITHCFGPVYDKNSKVLVLGTMPSPKSRENGFYYSHPQNRFWRVIAGVLKRDVPESAAQKRALLLESGIAMWDVLRSCSIRGASDASIRDAVPNDLSEILDSAQIVAIFTTGRKAAELYKKHCEKACGIPAICLPSTSPANRARCTYEDLTAAYSVILDYLGYVGTPSQTLQEG